MRLTVNCRPLVGGALRLMDRAGKVAPRWLRLVSELRPGDRLVGGASSDKTLIEHWDGGGWSIVTSPSPASNDTLTGVAARSATDVWAVGTRVDRSGAIPIDRTLTEHWNGTSWSVVASPNVGANDNLLNGVSATPGDVWAVGSSNVTAHTLILREPADRERHHAAPAASSQGTTHRQVHPRPGSVLPARLDAVPQF